MVVLGTLTEGEHPTAARIRRAWAQAPREEGMAANRRGFRYLMTHPHKSVLFRQRDADGLLYLVVKLPGRQ